MAEKNDLFDDEPTKPAEERSGDQPSTAGADASGRRGALSRRHFLLGAGAAAAGAAVATGATIGISSLAGGGSKKSVQKTSPSTGTNGTAASTGTSATGGATTASATGSIPTGQVIGQALIKLNINGSDEWLSVAPHQSLAEVLRQELGLTGTKVGCDRSECGACTVIIDGVPHNSCSLLAIREEGKKIVTIEGLEQAGKLSPVQQAFMDDAGLQCGFCTPGQIMQATALLQSNPKADEAAIRHAMSGNLCKCAAYPNILAAIQTAAKAMAG